jgi:hypothetical protein
MPLNPGRFLNSSSVAYGHCSTLWPFTFISNAMLPTDESTDTTVLCLVSWSSTTSPVCRAVYCCANTGSTNPAVNRAITPATTHQRRERRIRLAATTGRVV